MEERGVVAEVFPSKEGVKGRVSGRVGGGGGEREGEVGGFQD